MGRALKDQAPVDPEPWKLSSNQAQAQAFKQARAQALTDLYFLLNKNSNLLGPSQKVKLKPGPFSKFQAQALKKRKGPGPSPSLAWARTNH